MTDTRLRELERRWKETGSVEDEAALLVECVRVGALPMLRLQLAARLDYGPATLALNGADDVPSLEELLGSLGKESIVRCGIALARHALPQWETARPDAAPRRAIEAAERWVLAAPGEARNAARRAAKRAFGRHYRNAHASEFVVDEPTEVCTFRLAVTVVHLVWASQRTALREFVGRVTPIAFKTLPAGCDGIAQLAAVAKELVPWALGYFDEIRLRASGAPAAR